MDGHELARRLKAQEETSRSVLMAVTGYGQDTDRNNSQAAGFSRHFVKPLDTSLLANALAELT
jgi:CheY-like chemotaxis protein